MKNYSNSNFLTTLTIGMLLVVFGCFANAFIYWLLWDHAIVPVFASLGYTLIPIEFSHFAVISAVIACLKTTTRKENEKLEMFEAWVKFLSIIFAKVLMVLVAILLTKMLL